MRKNENVKTDTVMQYNSKLAIQYARSWSHTDDYSNDISRYNMYYNPEYKSHFSRKPLAEGGGWCDCANFVSQAIHEGVIHQ